MGLKILNIGQSIPICPERASPFLDDFSHRTLALQGHLLFPMTSVIGYLPCKGISLSGGL
jgi:hypothetical protein